MNQDLSIVGKNVKRVDAVAKAMGTAKFTVDIQLKDMVYMKFLRSPLAHGKIKSIDTSKAENMAGVIGVVSQLDIKGKCLHHDIMDDHVRYFGEAVIGIAAISEEIAEEAVSLLEVEYEPFQEMLSAKEAMEGDAVPIWQKGNVCSWQGPRSAAEGSSSLWEKGNVQKAFQKSAVVVENHLETHAQYHCCLEPHAVAAKWDAGLGEMTLWISSQSIYQDQENIANLLNLPLEKVRILCPFVGGGFGSKAHNTCKEYYFVAYLTKKYGRSIRYTPTRSEEVISAIRHPASFSYKIGADKKGHITAISMKALRSGGSHTSLQMNFLAGSTDYVAPTYLKSPNIKYEGWSTYTNLPLCAAFRGFGYFESGTAFTQAVDMAAEKLGMDPLEFLIKNVPGRGDPVGTDQGPLTTGGIRKTITACAKEINWKEKWHEPGTKKLSDGRMHGIAVAHAMGRSTLPDFVTSGNATFQVKIDGSAHIFAGISDIGQGQATGLVQIAAEALGLRMEDVHITWGDTVAPHTGSQVASSTTMMTGNPVRLAALDAKSQILKYAEPVLETTPEELDITNSIVFVKSNPEKYISVTKVLQLPGVHTIIGNGKWSISDKKASPKALVVSIVEVAVDTDTGKIQVLNMVQGTECGRIISPNRVEGQLQSVLSGGIGFMLTEDWIMDKTQHGRILNLNLLDYKVPTFLDTQGILKSCVMLEDPDPEGPFGARGMGEASLSASAPAILNAVYNAIGVRFNSTPLTPDKVLNALKKIS